MLATMWGMQGGHFVDAGGVVDFTTISLADSNSGGSSVSLSSLDIQAGDLGLLSGYEMGSPNSSPSVPSGWTEIGTASDGGDDVAMFAFRVMDGTETGSIDFNLADGHWVVILRCDKAISTATLQDADEEWTSGNPTAQVKNVGSFSQPSIVVANYLADGDTINPRTFSGMTADGEAEPGNDETWFKWRLVLTGDTPVNITVDMDDEGPTNWLFSAILEIT